MGHTARPPVPHHDPQPSTQITQSERQRPCRRNEQIGTYVCGPIERLCCDKWRLNNASASRCGYTSGVGSWVDLGGAIEVDRDHADDPEDEQHDQQRH